MYRWQADRIVVSGGLGGEVLAEIPLAAAERACRNRCRGSRGSRYLNVVVSTLAARSRHDEAVMISLLFTRSFLYARRRRTVSKRRFSALDVGARLRVGRRPHSLCLSRFGGPGTTGERGFFINHPATRAIQAVATLSSLRSGERAPDAAINWFFPNIAPGCRIRRR